MECSSKEMTGVHEIFETAIDTVIEESDGRAASAAERANPSKSTGGTTTTKGLVPKKKKKNACRIL